MKRTMCAVWAVALLMVGCASDSGTSDGRLGQTGLALSVQADGVAGVKFSVTPCAGGEATVVTKWLEDMTLPGGIPAFENAPFDPESQHFFADNYFVLPAGCYDVTAVAVDGEGIVVETCSAAQKDDVQVQDGLTTEILLVIQCEGPEVGGLDVVGALNHPPQVNYLSYSPSKFVKQCEGDVVCFVAIDPDSDPMEIVWSQVSGPTPAAGPTVISHEYGGTAPNRWLTECVQVVLKEVGTYQFKATVYDLVHDGASTVRMEDWLASQGNPQSSHDSLQFPIHVGSGFVAPPTNVVCNDEPVVR